MAKRVVVKEVVVAEVLEGPRPGHRSRGSRVTSAVADVNVLVGGLAPGVGLGSGMVSAFHGLALGAHNATAAQSGLVITQQSTTVMAAARLLAAARKRRG
ncbi:RebB family R body protein [Corallococcus exiguus]|uniref:RebB family R body protein n=1 Tax=Corallococcus exiguus TaxID=83462 RepID=UPI00155FF7E3|nr:RebB family R body protein [Corallococcus exiguus]MBN8466724.1 RebB family R body protein [Corallococcus exiguus]NRD43921.1 RebB family R body protein [Corallococcus exiguus]